MSRLRNFRVSLVAYLPGGGGYAPRHLAAVLRGEAPGETGHARAEGDGHHPRATAMAVFLPRSDWLKVAAIIGATTTAQPAEVRLRDSIRRSLGIDADLVLSSLTSQGTIAAGGGDPRD